MTLFASFITPLAHGEIYTWIDDNGVTHFSDTPEPGAYQIEVDVTPAVTRGPLATPRSTRQSTKNAPTSISYQLSITSPADQSTIRSNSGGVTITSSVTPKRPQTTLLRLILDDVPQGVLQRESIFKLTNVDRGSHRIQVQLVDASGKVLSTSESITIFVLRHSQSQASGAS
jgi:hypothetical protein